MEEIWKDITDYDYAICNKGIVKSLSRIVKSKSGTRITKEMNLKNRIDKNGYHYVGLCKKGKVKNFKIHRLLAEYFIRKPKKGEVINHKNGIKDDNRLENLEWTTMQKNVQHAYDTGLIDVSKKKMKKGVDNHNSKMNNKYVLWARYLHKKSKSIASISRAFNVNETAIRSIINNKTWKHV